MAVGCTISLASVEVYEAQCARVMTGPGGRPKHGWHSKCHRPVASCYRHRPIWAERLLSTGAPPAIHQLGPRGQHASTGTTLTPIHQDLLWVTGKEETSSRFIISRKTNTKKKYPGCHSEVAHVQPESPLMYVICHFWMFRVLWKDFLEAFNTNWIGFLR